MRPQDANLAGNVHGGVVMMLCDEAAALAAIRHCGTRVVTAAMDRMIFLNPVYVGNLVTFRSSVNAAWRSSMEVGVRVEAEDIVTGTITHTSSAYLTMVSLDEEGRPLEVPPIAPETDEDNRRHREAELRRESRLAERTLIIEGRGAMRGGTLPGFPAPPSRPAKD
jgi:acyl-CoA hydrolase